MAGQRIGMRQRPQFNQNLQTQGANLNANPNGLNAMDPTGKVGETQGSDKIMQQLEELLKKFMETMQGCENCGGGEKAAGGGGGEKAGGAGGAQGGQEAMFTLEELLKKMRELAQQNPQALQQFLQQNPQLAQMLGGAVGGDMGAALGGGGAAAPVMA